MTDDQGEWLDVAAIAARYGIKAGTWRAYVSRGQAPAPDDPDAGRPAWYRRPRWRAATLDGWTRPGQGARTDVAAARRKAAAGRRAELAEHRQVDANCAAWLAANHRGLLDAADALVDLRDALAAGDETGLLADTIDQAGEAMSGRPSLALASAVTYALFLARTAGDTAGPLARFGYLRTGYEAVRPRRPA